MLTKCCCSTGKQKIRLEASERSQKAPRLCDQISVAMSSLPQKNTSKEKPRAAIIHCQQRQRPDTNQYHQKQQQQKPLQAAAAASRHSHYHPYCPAGFAVGSRLHNVVWTPPPPTLWWDLGDDNDLATKKKTNAPPHQGGARALVARCMRTLQWTQENARRVLHSYKQFLELKALYRDWNDTAVSAHNDSPVHCMWKVHSQDAHAYLHDCRLLCGGHLAMNNHTHQDSDSGRQQQQWQHQRQVWTRQVLQQHYKEHYDADMWMPLPLTNGKQPEQISKLTHNQKQRQGLSDGSSSSKAQPQGVQTPWNTTKQQIRTGASTAVTASARVIPPTTVAGRKGSSSSSDTPSRNNCKDDDNNKRKHATFSKEPSHSSKQLASSTVPAFDDGGVSSSPTDSVSDAQHQSKKKARVDGTATSTTPPNATMPTTTTTNLSVATAAESKSTATTNPVPAVVARVSMSPASDNNRGSKFHENNSMRREPTPSSEGAALAANSLPKVVVYQVLQQQKPPSAFDATNDWRQRPEVVSPLYVDGVDITLPHSSIAHDASTNGRRQGPRLINGISINRTRSANHWKAFHEHPHTNSGVCNLCGRKIKRMSANVVRYHLKQHHFHVFEALRAAEVENLPALGCCFDGQQVEHTISPPAPATSALIVAAGGSVSATKPTPPLQTVLKGKARHMLSHGSLVPKESPPGAGKEMLVEGRMRAARQTHCMAGSFPGGARNATGVHNDELGVESSGNQNNNSIFSAEDADSTEENTGQRTTDCHALAGNDGNHNDPSQCDCQCSQPTPSPHLLPQVQPDPPLGPPLRHTEDAPNKRPLNHDEGQQETPNAACSATVTTTSVAAARQRPQQSKITVALERETTGNVELFRIKTGTVMAKVVGAYAKRHELDMTRLSVWMTTPNSSQQHTATGHGDVLEQQEQDRAKTACDDRTPYSGRVVLACEQTVGNLGLRHGARLLVVEESSS